MSLFDAVDGNEKNDLGKLGWKFPEKNEDSLENVDGDELLDDDGNADCDCLGSLTGLCSVP